MKKFIRFLFISALLLAAAAGALWWELNRPLAPAALPQVFMMEKGMGPRRTERKLSEAGLLRRPWEFRLALELRGAMGKLKAGEYEITAPASPLQLVDLLVSGKVKTYKVTVPEGYTVEKIAAAVAATGLIAPPEAREIAQFAERYEGHAYPDTYLFTRPLTLAQALEQMAKRGEQYWTAEKQERLKALGITRQQALIMASIVEKETALPAERPMVAAVIYNRLKLGMPLQMDPTNIYGLEREGKYHGVLGHTQIIVDTPYSTYHHAGLPPGPIGSPGPVSLDAVLHPADSGVLYFVADGSGGHRFARTEKEHELNVARWRAMKKD
jgi:UPF0755 protein